MIKSENQLLKIKIDNGILNISIGISTLVNTIGFDYLESFSSFKITDENTLAKAIAEELKDEAEDGTTLIHHAFDSAIEQAIENGCEGIEIKD